MTLLLLLSCGKASKVKSYPQEQKEISDGIYAAVLYPVNLMLSPNLQGGVKVSKFGDDFKVRIKLKDATPGIHEQYLYSGSECPSAAHDKNGDGIIDATESQAVMGSEILPFDGDLSSVEGGEGVFPEDSYEYIQSASFSLMLTDLEHSHHKRILELENRIVMIIQAGAHPLACGVLAKISDVPEIERPPSPPPSDSDRYPPRPPERPPKPEPPPRVEPEPPAPPQESWWDQIRSQWRRWRDSVRDWWRSLG